MFDVCFKNNKPHSTVQINRIPIQTRVNLIRNSQRYDGAVVRFVLDIVSKSSLDMNETPTTLLKANLTKAKPNLGLALSIRH